MVSVPSFSSIRMKNPLVKRTKLVASLLIASLLLGLAMPLEAYAVPELGQEQAVVLAASSEATAQIAPAAPAVAESVAEAVPQKAHDHQTTPTWSESPAQRLEHLLLSISSWDMWRLIWGGLQTTVVIFIFAAIAAILLGAMLAYLAISHKWPWFYKPLNWFVTTVHDIPSVALMMFFYYVIFAGEMNGIVVSIIALGVYTSGSLAKIFKIHIQQVGNGQIEAGRALGMTRTQCYCYIVLPQAVKSMLPLFIADLKVQLRATSYAGYIAQQDLIKAVFAVREQYSDTFLPLIIVSIFYLILSWMITQVIHLLYVKFFKYD